MTPEEFRNTCVAWEPEALYLETADCINSPEDFDRLCHYVLSPLEKEAQKAGEVLYDRFPLETLRTLIKRYAATYDPSRHALFVVHVASNVGIELSEISKR